MRLTKFNIFGKKISIYFNHCWDKDPVRRSKWKSRGYFFGFMFKSNVSPRNSMWSKIFIIKGIWIELVINIDKVK
jgi:hypothetical protein